MAHDRREPVWLERFVVDAVHTAQIREHGGLPGVRDENALESALARPRQKWHDDEEADLATLAAAYGFGLTKGHPYRDGNKRIGFLALVIFLGLNGYDFEAPEEEVVTVMLAVASSRTSERRLAGWVREHMVPMK